MEDLIELVIKNPFLLILILGGVFSLLRGKPKQTQEEQQDQRREPSTSTAEPPTLDWEQASHNHDEEIQTQPVQSLSIDEQREKQLKRLTEQFNPTTSEDHSGMKDRPKIADAKRSAEIQRIATPYNKKFKKNFEKNLTRKGLVQSIVMAEVLGAPRARKPYQSVIVNRRNK